jgi:hypothetical protein
MDKKTLVDLIEDLKKHIDEDENIESADYRKTLSKRSEDIINYFESIPGDLVVVNKRNNIDYLNCDDSCEY